VPGASGITRAQFEKLTTEALIAHLAVKELTHSEKLQAIFRDQEIDGEGLLAMTKEDLERYGVPGGVVVKVMLRIPQ